jgi:hypothetical protein
MLILINIKKLISFVFIKERIIINLDLIFLSEEMKFLSFLKENRVFVIERFFNFL